MKNIHKEFVRLGRERNRITYKLLSLLPEIEKQKIYRKEGYANIYDYAAKIAGLSPGVVKKALRLEEKLEDMPHLQKTIETQGINKVSIIAGLATSDNERELAEKVENMSKPALQEYSKELRGKVTASWQVELDQEMMFMFLKLKKKLGKNLSNKECLRKMLKMMEGEESEGKSGSLVGARDGQSRGMRMKSDGISSGRSESNDVSVEKIRSQQKAKKLPKIPGEKLEPQKRSLRDISNFAKIFGENLRSDGRTQKLAPNVKKITRYIPVQQKQHLPDQCEHPNCHRPATIIHHTKRFSTHRTHEHLKHLCKQHHEFAHNGISEPMQREDYRYREFRQVAMRV